MIFPFIALGLFVVYAIAKANEHPVELAQGGGGAGSGVQGDGTQGSAGGAQQLGLAGGDPNVGLLAKILSSGANASWYSQDAGGNRATNAIGRSQLAMLLSGYSNIPAWDRPTDGGMTHQAWTSDYTQGQGFDPLSVFIRKLQAVGGSVYLSQADVDALANGQKPTPIDYVSTGNPAAWQASGRTAGMVLLTP